MAGYILQAHASAQAGTLLPRERQKQEYQQALVERYKHLPDVKRISRHRHLPTPIYKVTLYPLLPNALAQRLCFVQHYSLTFVLQGMHNLQR